VAEDPEEEEEDSYKDLKPYPPFQGTS